MVELIKSRLRYKDGVLKWLPTGDLAWDSKLAGKEAGYLTKRGYRNIKLGGKVYKAHRLAWLLVKGEWPELGLDHINGIKHDNRIENLREATSVQNNQNKPPRGRFKGIVLTRSGKFCARIVVEGSWVYLGRFPTEGEAALAYNKAAIEHFGEFANLNKI